MTTTVADRALLDTNVLLAATDVARPDHDRARETLEVWPARGVSLYLSGQIVREYLAVATRPQAVNGLGMTGRDALGNVRAFRTRTTLLAEDVRVTERLLRLLDTAHCTGKQVHDANIVATMLVHGVDTVVTLNPRDFTRFASEIRVVDLAA